MTRLVPISAKKLIYIIERLGYQELRRRGSHRFFFNPATGFTTVIPDHGSEDIGRGLLRSILRDINVGIEEFAKLR